MHLLLQVLFLQDINKLLQIGDLALEKRQYAYAAKAFELAGTKDKLSKLADICFNEGLYNTAYKLYKQAGNAMMIQFIFFQMV